MTEIYLSIHPRTTHKKWRGCWLSALPCLYYYLFKYRFIYIGVSICVRSFWFSPFGFLVCLLGLCKTGSKLDTITLKASICVQFYVSCV
jgi:hypothetical protein